MNRLLVIVGLLIAIVVAFRVASSFTPSDPDSGARSNAYLACRMAVIERLKAPSSASFAVEYDDRTTITAATAGRWRVVSSVDAQNSFGAVIRQSYTCVVQPDGGRWSVESLDISE